MPRPFKQLTPEPIIPIEGGAGGGAPGVNVEDHGTPIANNPHTTLNLAGTVSVADAGSGTATITVTGGGGGFTDNANAERLRKNPWTRRLENDTQVSINSLSIGGNQINDYATGPELTCLSVMTVRDKFFFVGDIGGTSLNQGSLYVMSLYDYSYNSTTVPLNNLGRYGDAPVDLIGVAGLGNPDNGTGGDFIFALLPNLSQYQLGYAYTDNVLPLGKVLYGNINSGTVVPGAAVRACYVAGGGGDPNFGTSGVYGPGFVPMFAISSTNGHIYLTDANSGIHDAFNTSDTPGAMFVDNEGFLWAALTTSKTLVKYSINFTSFTLSQVSSYATAGVSALDMIQDGRRAWILWLDTNNFPHLSSWQLSDGTVGPSFDGRLTAVTPFKDIVDGYYDTTRNLIWTADQFAFSTKKALVSINASTQATNSVVPIPTVATNGQLPIGWSGVRRVIGDATNVYALDTSGTSPDNQKVAIINQNSGQVVGLCQVTGAGPPKARDLAVNGNDLYVVARTSSITNSTVQRFSISAAISSYPSPVSPLATSAVGSWHVCCYDPVSNLVFVGTNTSGSPPETLATLDPVTLATVNSQSFATSASFSYFFGLTAGFGSVWAGTAAPSVFRINGLTFPAGGSVTTITAGTTRSWQIYIDTTNSTVLVADDGQAVISRISPGSNTQVSTIPSPGGGVFYNIGVPTPSAIWVGAFHSPNAYWQRFTTTVGSETPLNQVAGWSTSFSGYTGRLGWDGNALWLSWFQPIVAGAVSPLTKLDPETGELLGQFTGTGYEGTNYGPAANPRGFAIDSSGTVIAPTYDPTISGVSQINIIQPAAEDRYFNSIRGLAKPLGYTYGGRQFGQVNPSNTTVTLTPQTMTAMVNTSTGASTVDLIQPGSWPTQYGANGNTVDWRCTVGDATGNAATNHITVGGVSYQVEDPNTPGTFNTSITISQNWQVVTWQFDLVQLRWKVLSSNASGGGSSVGVPTGFVLVGNGNPSTGTLDATHLQAIVDTSVAVTTVNAPDLSLPATQQLFRVTDNTGFAATFPITVQSQAGRSIEDPNNHGTFATSVQITVNSQSIDWQWTGSHYKIV